MPRTTPSRNRKLKARRIPASTRASRGSARGPQKLRHAHHLPPWLKPKLEFLHSHAENRELFFDRIAEIFPRTDPRYLLIEKAYDTAKAAFKKRFRDDGETRYFEHLRSAALIGVVYLRLRDANLIAALLLHDIIEDIPRWTQERIAREFNTDVADIVWWVTKPKKSKQLRTKEDVDRKYHRQLRDAPRRAVIVKLCDRLHNLVTLWAQDIDKMRRKVSETRDFIIPLAEQHQLLIHEIEDVLRLVEHRYGF